MLIEYRIKFEKDGLTISHRIEPNSSSAQIASPRVIALGTPASAATPNPITKVSADPSSGMNPGDQSTGMNPGDQSTGMNPGDPSTGGSLAGQAPIFVLGPIVFNNPIQASPTPPEPPNDQPPKAYRAKATS